jgi:hypothetical protein
MCRRTRVSYVSVFYGPYTAWSSRRLCTKPVPSTDCSPGGQASHPVTRKSIEHLRTETTFYRAAATYGQHVPLKRMGDHQQLFLVDMLQRLQPSHLTSLSLSPCTYR